MNVHKNARLTPFGRERLVKQVLERVLTPAAAAAAAGVSLRTIYKWLSRYRKEGAIGLCDRVSRPRRLRCALNTRQRQAIERLRRERRPYREIAKRVHAPLSTVARELRRIGLNRLRVLDPKPLVQRYEHERPGELVHLDIKRLSRFWRPGHRVHDHHKLESPGAGYQFLHVAIDDHARVAYGELFRDERGLSVARFLARVVAYYRRLGIKIIRVLTDNGAGYRSRRFHRACQRLGIKHSLILGPTDRKPMAKPSASSRPHYANGPTCAPTPISASAPRLGCLGCIAITGTARTPASTTNHLSAVSACL